MESPATSMTTMADLISCSNCKKIFDSSKHPNMLECEHVSCEKCLERNDAQGFVICPISGKKTFLSSHFNPTSTGSLQPGSHFKKVDLTTEPTRIHSSSSSKGKFCIPKCSKTVSVGPHDERTISLPDYDVSLEIPAGAVTKEVDITMSTVSPFEAQVPTIDNSQIIAPIISIEPDDLQLLKPATLTVGHSGVQLSSKCLKIVTKATGKGKFPVVL